VADVPQITTSKGLPPMLRKAAAIGAIAGMLATTAIAQEDRVPNGIPRLDHVFLIMIENHGGDPGQE
jgi:hypothetical protein